MKSETRVKTGNVGNAKSAETSGKTGNTKVIFFVLMTGTFWGLSFLGTSLLIKNGIDPIQIQVWRWMIASLCFIIMIALGKLRINFRKKSFKLLVLTGLFQPCIYMILENYGVKLTSASVGSIFVAIIPCAVLVINTIFFGRKTSARGKLSIFLAIAGVAIATMLSPAFSAGGNGLGYLLMLGAVLAGALYSCFSSLAGSDEYKPMEVTAMMAFEGAIFFNILNVAMGYGVDTFIDVATNPALLGGVVFLGACCSAICYLLMNNVPSIMDPAVGNNIITAWTTIVGALAGIFIGGDPGGWYTAVGLSLTVVGVWFASKEV